jgi:transcriptional regulator with XRE-family HTH domain
MRLREAAQVTQREAARAMGIKGPTLSNFERGVREPSLSVLIAAARYYGCPLAKIISERD